MTSLRKTPSDPGPPQNFSTSSAVARMSCERATVKTIKNKLVTYRDLREGLKASREEFDRSEGWDDAVNAGLMALRWTKASCDAFISMAAAASSVVLPNNAAGAVKGAYTATAAIAEAGSTALNGGKVDKLALVRDIKDGVIDIAGDRVDKLAGGKGSVTGLVNLQVNIGIDAVRGDKSALVLQATAGEFSEIAKLAGKHAKELKLAGAETASNGFAAVVDIASAGVKFSNDLDAASEAYLDTKVEIAGRRRSIRRTLIADLNRIEHRIRELEYTLDACVYPLSEEQYESVLPEFTQS